MNYLQEMNSFNDWLILNPSASSDDIVLWYALMNLNNISGWQKEFTVAISTIMDRTRLSRSAIYRSRNKLVQFGRIKTRERGGNQCSVYEVIPFSSVKTPPPVSPNETQVGTHSGTQVGTHSGTQPGTIIKTKVNETKEYLINISFDEFWDAYDKKKGSIKKIKKMWERLKDEDREAIMKYIPLYKLEQPEKTWRKNPETFLNNEGWKDEIILQKPQFNGSNQKPTGSNSERVGRSDINDAARAKY